MKLLTDTRDDRAAFAKDFEKVCRHYSRVGGYKAKYGLRKKAKDVVGAAKMALEDPLGCLEGDLKIDDENEIPVDLESWFLDHIQAMQWMGLVIFRWVLLIDAPGDQPVEIDEHAQEMFVGIAMRVAEAVAGPDFYAPGADADDDD